MTIRRGEAWGGECRRPPDLFVVGSDAALAATVVADRADDLVRPLSVSGGDLHRALGAPGDRERMQLLPLDLLHIVADRKPLVAVAHVVVRRSWWHGPLLAICNVDQIGAWKVAPRAHPNDGKLDIVEVASTMRPRDRWMARSRLPQGSHVPHPKISVRAVADANWQFERPQGLWIDGVAIGRVTDLSVTIEPDAFELHV